MGIFTHEWTGGHMSSYFIILHYNTEIPTCIKKYKHASRNTNMHQEIQICIQTITNHTNFISLFTTNLSFILPYLTPLSSSFLSFPYSSPTPYHPCLTLLLGELRRTYGQDHFTRQAPGAWTRPTQGDKG